MKDLKCGLKACVYNKGYSCTSKQISVSSNHDCNSFAPDENKRKMQFESASDFVAVNYTVDTKVSCSAHCIFNKQGECHSNGITVTAKQPNDACCLTYIEEQ